MNHTSILQFRTANCKNCYKCIRNCPVKAIKVTNQQAQIIEEQCILCEKCIAVCPQHAKVEHNDIPELQKVIAAGIPVLTSKAVPTDQAIELAKKYHLNLICRAWPDRMEIYHDARK